jgi:protoporphyrinogen oxidase
MATTDNLQESTIILGAGLTGLSTQWHLQKAGIPSQLFEKEDRGGGLVRSETVNGFTFDYTGHLLHFRSPEIRDWVQSLLPGNLQWQKRDARIYSHQAYTRYPFQMNLYGLPPNVIKECILEYVKAEGFRLSSADPNPMTRSPLNFEDWTMAVFGKGISRFFMLPYNEKLWTIPARELSCEWMGRFVPLTSLDEMVEGALEDGHGQAGYNPAFHYPVQGGIESLPRSLSQTLPALICGHEAVEVDLEKRRVIFQNGNTVAFSHLVSTLPLPCLIQICRNLPESIRAAGEKLRWVSVLNLNLGIKRPVGAAHWIYYPEQQWSFYRVGFPSNFSQAMAPPGCGSISVEVSRPGGDTLPKSQMAQEIQQQLLATGLLTSGDEIVAECIFTIPYAYVIDDHACSKSVKIIQDFLKESGVFSIGRYGAWEYSSMEDALIAGRETAGKIVDRTRGQFSR